MIPDWPQAGHPAELVLTDGRTYPLRIVDVDGHVFMVDPPPFARQVATGGQVGICWAGERGLYSVTGTMVGTAGSDHALWILECTYPPVINSRRGAVRSPVSVPIRMIADGGETWEGRVRDLSESGLRFALHGVETPGDGLEVGVELDLNGTEAAMPGVVLRSEHDRNTRTTDVVVLLHPEEDAARAIRRFVLESQIRARKVGGR